MSLFEKNVNNFVLEAKKYGRIFEFWIRNCGIENHYGVTGLTEV